jgi:hypothetical protein
VTPDELKTAGMLLYGRYWKTPIANQLSIRTQTVDLIMKEKIGVASRHEVKIRELLMTRVRLLQAMIANGFSPPPPRKTYTRRVSNSPFGGNSLDQH